MGIIRQQLNKVRNLTPLTVRQRVGPILAEIAYQKRILLEPSDRRPKVLSMHDTVKKIRAEKLSALRFGDGELTILEEEPLLFQKYDGKLAEGLRESMANPSHNTLLCIPNFWQRLDHFEVYAQKFIKHHIFHYRYLWEELINNNVEYGDAYFSRPYLGLKDKTQSGDIFSDIKSLWNHLDITLVEGEKSRLGVGNDLFSNTKSIKRILAPAENAFSKYYELLEATKTTPPENLILLSLGPTAKVLGHDLIKLGYRVIDIGHIDMEYEMFLRSSPTLIKVPYKYFNEINARNPEDCEDKNYQSQIIARVI